MFRAQREGKKLGGAKRKGEGKCLAFSRIIRKGEGVGTRRHSGEMLQMCLYRKEVEEGEGTTLLAGDCFHMTWHSRNPTGSLNGSLASRVNRPPSKPKVMFSPRLCPASRLPTLPPTGAAYWWAHLHVSWYWAGRPGLENRL